jgi:ankyrin repeat protein
MEKPSHDPNATQMMVERIIKCVKYAGDPSHDRMSRADTLLAPHVAVHLLRGADPNAKSDKACYYHAKKNLNRSILRVATELSLPKIMHLLLNAGADPDDIDQHGLKPILYYAKDSLVPLLLSHGADPDKGHHYIWASLPAFHSDTDYNQLLLNCGADPNSRYSDKSRVFDGYTFLMWAAYYANNVYPGNPKKRIDRIEMFLNAGADRTMKNPQGKTAADIAREQGIHDIADLLSKPRKIS